MPLVLYNQILNVDISTYVNAAIFRHLRMFGNLKSNVFMLPVHETKSLKKEVNLDELASIDFSVSLQGNTYKFKLMIKKDSKCHSLLTPEFINNIVWALDEQQNYVPITLPILEDSFNYVYEVSIDEEKYSEVIYLNVCNIQ